MVWSWSVLSFLKNFRKTKLDESIITNYCQKNLFCKTYYTDSVSKLSNVQGTIQSSKNCPKNYPKSKELSKGQITKQSPRNYYLKVKDLSKVQGTIQSPKNYPKPKELSKVLL